MTSHSLVKFVSDARLHQQHSSKLDQVLWVVDENAGCAELIHYLSQLDNNETQNRCLSNRCDTAAALAAHCETSVNDFDFSFIPDNSLSTLVYRISKERSLVHHVLLAAHSKLQTGGTLLLSGKKKEGIKNYFDVCRKQLNFAAKITKQGDDYLCELIKTASQAIPASTINKLNTYTQEQKIVHDGLSFLSKPGIYGWNKRDHGSAFLIQHLAGLNLQSKAARILDLGCGYGYLALQAAKLLQPQTLTATDNNFTAVAYCQQNLLQHFPGKNYQSKLDDCGQKLSEAYDLIICNPPFHQGFDNNFELTRKFLQAARRLLAPQGKALFVFNAFVPAEQAATNLFKQVEQIANNRQFKIYLLSKG